MNRIAVDFGFIQIYWYSLLILLAILSSSIIIYFEIKKRKIDQDFFINLLFNAVIFGFIGARLYYVVFNLDYYLKYPIEILEIWNGGLAIHGGLLFGGIFTLIYCKKYKQNTLKILDIIVVGLILGQAIGRWGNFFNQEAYGAVTTIAKLKSAGIPDFIINGMNILGEYHQPTFFYESIWNFFGFIALLLIRKYPRLKIGQLTGFYLIWYSSARIIIEGMRMDSLMLDNFRIAQIVSIGCILIGLYLFFIHPRRGLRFENLYAKDDE